LYKIENAFIVFTRVSSFPPLENQLKQLMWLN